MAIHRRLFRRWADPHVADKVRLLRATLSSSVGNRDGKPGMAKSDADGLPLLEAIERIKVDAQARQRPECRVSLNLLCRLIKSTANGFRGFLQLPHPMGREEERLLVFCPPDQVADLRALGAHHVGGADLIEPIVDGKLQFTRCLGHPDLLPVLTKLARVLGPLGLMPNVKHGTLTPNLRDAVLRAFSTTPYVVAKQTGVLNLCVGRADFASEHIERNVQTVLEAMQALGADSVRKRSFVLQATLAGSGMRGSLALHPSVYERPAIRVVPPSASTAPILSLQS